MSEFNWNCPHCNSPQTVTDKKSDSRGCAIRVGDNADGKVGYVVHCIGCSNPKCKKISIVFEYGAIDTYSTGEFHSMTDVIIRRRIIPDSYAVAQPDIIPKQLRDDYKEACLIRDLSPKASATLSRRCLQGMIRDFCGISKSRLVDEVTTLRKLVEEGKAPPGVSIDSIDAIDALRRIGNIGAHMEKDINVIVDVDPNEAQALIELLESLFDDWYIAREKRQRRFARVTEVATNKEQLKASAATREAGD